jgi:hypothetical protein
MAYSGGPSGDILVWGGGDYFSGQEYTDYWIWSAVNHWVNIGTPAGPAPTFRLQAMFTYDDGTAGSSAGIYLFGGTADYNTNTGTTYSETWLWY